MSEPWDAINGHLWRLVKTVWLLTLALLGVALAVFMTAIAYGAMLGVLS